VHVSAIVVEGRAEGSQYKRYADHREQNQNAEAFALEPRLLKGDGFFTVFAHRLGGAKHSSDPLGLLQSSGSGSNAEIENSFQDAAPHHGRANL
jgi:hypothetical protein